MGNQTGRNFLGTYRAPLIVFAIIATAMALDYRFLGSDPDAYAHGVREFEATHYNAAIAEFGKALRANPADSAARLGLGRCYQAIGWTAEAVSQYEMSAKKASDTLKQSYLNLSAISEKLGQKDEAKRYLRSAQSL